MGFSILFRLVLSIVAVGVGVYVGLTELARRSVVPPAADRRYDAIVVLGCRVNADGSPSDALLRRATRAAELFHDGYADRVVTTGGVGDVGPSEASVAAGVLAARGVPTDRILMEDDSTSTEENARFAKGRFGGSRVLIVTDGFHTLRARRTFERFFSEVDAVGTNGPWVKTRRAGTMREVVALGAYLILGRMDAWPPPSRGSGSRGERFDVVGKMGRRVAAGARSPAMPPFSLGGPFGPAGFLLSCGVHETRRFCQRSHAPLGPRARRASG